MQRYFRDFKSSVLVTPNTIRVNGRCERDCPMFTKKQDVAVRSDAMMRGKELKTFRAQLGEALGLGEDALAAIAPPKVPWQPPRA